MVNPLITKFEAYLLTERRVAQNTFSAYKRDIQQLVKFLLQKKVPLEAVTAVTLKEFLHHLNEQNLNSRSIVRKISSLKILFDYLHERAGIANAAQDLIFPKIEKKLPCYLSETEIDQLLQAAERDTTSEYSTRNKVMLYLLYVSGVRVSELISIRTSDIQFDTAFLRVRGKGGRERMIPLPESMLTMLKEYMKNEHRSFTKKNKENRSTDYLFPIYYGRSVKPISRQAFWGILKNIWKKTGIQRTISPHQLRHSLATHLLKKGANLRSLQMLLGHENLATVQIYTHVETGYVRKIYDRKHPRS